MSEQDGLLNEFLVETCESLDHLDAELLALEENPRDSELINSIFRRLHTIKGVCGFLDLHKLESVSHAGETLLGALRSEELRVTDDIITLLLSLCDAIRTITKSIECTKTEGAEDFSALAEKLLQASKPSSAATAAGRELTIDEEFEAILAQREKAEVAQIQPASEIAPIAPAPAPVHESEVSPNVAAASTRNASQETSLRVDVNLLDNLMNLAGELVLARNQILQSTKGFNDAHFRAITQRLNLVTSELQEGVMKTRMQPISTVWGKFPRVVRDLAIACEKQVRLEMVGKETELDKTLIEAIKDPLTHIVRNSIDHGIERPDQRTSNGKSAEGCITMRAFQEGGYVIIEIEDDGGGLNTEKIKQRAVQRGLVSPEKAQSMSDAEVHRLIFAAGFSTADTITNLSGRGVGMDVVKSSVEKIGGQVDVLSRTGQGSTIRLKIPLTLAIIPALLLSCDGKKFAVPQSAVMELVQYSASERSGSLSWIGTLPFYRLRGELLPILYLKQQLGMNADIKEGSEHNVIVVFDVDGCRFGVVVDEVHDTEEIVVKPLGRQLSPLQIYAGATILGDGHIALIIDPVVLAREAQIEQNTEVAQRSLIPGPAATIQADDERFLIVEVTPDFRAGISLRDVKRLEEIAASTVEVVGGSAVVQYRGSILPLVNVGAALGMDSDLRGNLQVVVISGGDGLVGLQVGKIVDVSTAVTARKPARGREGISEFATVGGRVIALLDLPVIVAFGALNASAHGYSEEFRV